MAVRGEWEGRERLDLFVGWRFPLFVVYKLPYQRGLRLLRKDDQIEQKNRRPDGTNDKIGMNNREQVHNSM